jgi:peroxiredoxin
MLYKNLLPAIILIAASCACAQEARKAPDFTLKDLDGNAVSLSSFKGKAVFIDFWASWCPPCRNSIPKVEALYQKLKNENVAFLGINLESNPQSTKKFAAAQNMQYKILIDDQKTSGEYGVRGIPAFFILDAQGMIRQSYQGYSAGLEETWEKEIRELTVKIQPPQKPAKTKTQRKK